MKICKSCHKELSLDNFHNDKKRKDKKTFYCKFCMAARSKDWYQKNKSQILIKQKTKKAKEPERYKAYNYTYYRKNKEKATKAIKDWQERNKLKTRSYTAKRRSLSLENNFQISESDLQKLISQPCFYCQTEPSNSIDHIIPLIRGGRHAIGNLIGACRPCNSSKQSKTIMEFRVWKRNQIVIKKSHTLS